MTRTIRTRPLAWLAALAALSAVPAARGQQYRLIVNADNFVDEVYVGGVALQTTRAGALGEYNMPPLNLSFVTPTPENSFAAIRWTGAGGVDGLVAHFRRVSDNAIEFATSNVWRCKDWSLMNATERSQWFLPSFYDGPGSGWAHPRESSGCDSAWSGANALHQTTSFSRWISLGGCVSFIGSQACRGPSPSTNMAWYQVAINLDRTIYDVWVGGKPLFQGSMVPFPMTPQTFPFQLPHAVNAVAGIRWVGGFGAPDAMAASFWLPSVNGSARIPGFSTNGWSAGITVNTSTIWYCRAWSELPVAERTTWYMPDYDHSAWTFAVAAGQCYTNTFCSPNCTTAHGSMDAFINNVITGNPCSTAVGEIVCRGRSPSIQGQGDTVVPAFNATAGVATETTVPVSATASEPARLFCAAVANGSAALTAAQVRDAAVGGAILAAANSGATLGTAPSLTLGGLQSRTDLDIYCAAQDAVPNLNPAVQKLDVRTADLTAPGFVGGAPVPSVVRVDAAPVARVAATLNEPGRLYCAAALHVSPPAAYTSAQVKAAGQAASFPTGPGNAFVAGNRTLALQTLHNLDLSLLPATAYDVYCVAEDGATSGKLRALDNLQGSPTNTTIFTGGCLEGNASTSVPRLNLGGTSISGSNLVIRVDSSRHFAATRLAFVGSSDADCSMLSEVATGSQPAENEWAYSAETLSCNDAWTYTYLLTSALAECGFAEQGSTAEFTEYRATLEATTVENSSLVFGVETNRTERTAVVMGVRVPNLANVTNNASVFGAAIPITATTTQVFDTVNRNFSFALATSVQHPYELFVNPTATASSQADHTVYGAVAENDCASAGSGECLQRFAIGLRPASSACTVNSTLTTTFRVRCRASFTGACDALSLSQFTAAFQVLTDDFCARVVDIGAVSPSLEVYDSEAARNARAANSQTSDAVTSSLLFYRVDLVLEAGLLATSLNLTDVRIRSFCAEPCDELVQPVANGAVDPGAFAAYGFQVTSQAGSRADFQFQLNDNSISFDNNDPSGSVNVQVTVGAVVNYTTPSGQKRSRRVELLAATGGGSAAVSASAQFSASTAPAAPASVSGESTVLGMTQGTVIAAGAGLVAIVAVAAGAAVAAKRRSRRSTVPSSSRASLTAGQVRLDEAASRSTDTALMVPLGDLRVVQGAYSVAH